jgi:hypothetical protein
MALRQFTVAGVTSNSANWLGGVKPISTDAVIFYANPIIDEDLTVTTQDGTAPAIEFSEFSPIVVVSSGVTIHVNGNWKNTRNETVTTFNPGVVIEFGNDADYVMEHAGQWTIAGTQASPVTIRTEPGGPGYASVVQNPSWFLPHQLTIDWLVGENMGTEAIDGFKWSLNDDIAQTFIVRHSTFNNCGRIFHKGSYGTNTSIFDDNTITNSKNAICARLEGRWNDPATAVRSIQRNYFGGQVDFSNLSDYTFKHNILNSYYWPWGDGPWDFTTEGFQWNFLRKYVGADVAVPWVGFHDSYVLEDHSDPNPHFLACNSVNAGGNVIKGNIFHFTGSNGEGDLVLGGPGNVGTGVVPWVIERNIVLKNGAGGSSGTVTCHGSAYTDIKVRHNTFCLGPASANNIGESYAGHAGMISEWRSNLAYRSDDVTSGALINNIQGLAGPADVVTPAGCTHNCADVGTIAGSNGNGYNLIPLTSGSLGANDLPFETDPQLADPDRNVMTWDASLGGAGTVASAITRLKADPLLIEDMIGWVRDGFKPQNPDLFTAAHDGDTIGAVHVNADITGEQAWKDRIVELTELFLPVMQAVTPETWNANAHINHDGGYGMILLRQFIPGELDLLKDYEDAFFAVYRDIFVLTQEPVGWVAGPYLFPEGVGASWEIDGNTDSRDALIGLKNNGLWVNSDPDIIYERHSREAAYGYLVQHEAERLNLVDWDTTRVNYQVAAMKGHIGMWIGDPLDWVMPSVSTFTNDVVVQCFMMGITGCALAKRQEYLESIEQSDPEIMPLLARLAVRMRERFWEADNQQFFYQIGPDGTHVTPGNHTVLNNEASNFFGWLYAKTGCDYFAVAGDESWISGYESTEYWAPKQLHQLVRWSPLYVNWRKQTPLNDNEFYVVDAPVVARAQAGQASGQFKVLPMKSVTGTVTATDGEGWTQELTWDGSGEIQSFTYTPATEGDKVISFTNNMGFDDAPDITFRS